jgi:hypothetical protein
METVKTILFNLFGVSFGDSSQIEDDEKQKLLQTGDVKSRRRSSSNVSKVEIDFGSDSKPKKKPKATPKYSAKRSDSETKTPVSDSKPKKLARSRSKTPVKTSEKKTKKSTPSSTKHKAQLSGKKWVINGQSIVYVKDKSRNDWYEARPVASVAAVSARNLPSDPKLWTKTVIPETDDVIRASEGDWIKVHYLGYNERFDEWVEMADGGRICTNDSSCQCIRHS